MAYLLSIYVKEMLKGQLLLFMGQAIDLNYIPQVYPVMSKVSDCLIAVHPDNANTGFLGVMQNEYGRDTVVSYLIHLNKWAWAEDEGRGHDLHDAYLSLYQGG